MATNLIIYMVNQINPNRALITNHLNINHLPLPIAPAPHCTKHAHSCSRPVLELRVVGTIVSIVYQMRTLKHEVISDVSKITKLRSDRVMESRALGHESPRSWPLCLTLPLHAQGRRQEHEIFRSRAPRSMPLMQKARHVSLLP